MSNIIQYDNLLVQKKVAGYEILNTKTCKAIAVNGCKDYSEGYLSIKVGDNNMWTYINTTTGEIFPRGFKKVFPSHDGFRRVLKNNEKYSYINNKTNSVLIVEFDDATDCSEGYSAIRTNINLGYEAEWRMFDLHNSRCFGPYLLEVQPCKDGVINVKKPGITSNLWTEEYPNKYATEFDAIKKGESQVQNKKLEKNHLANNIEAVEINPYNVKYCSAKFISKNLSAINRAKKRFLVRFIEKIKESEKAGNKILTMNVEDAVRKINDDFETTVFGILKSDDPTLRPEEFINNLS